MPEPTRVATPPAKPLLVYDGDCRFCTLWIKRWQQTTGDRVDYLPFQNASIADRFPEIPRAEFESAVQLIETDGLVYRGAQAALRALAKNPARRWMQRCYERSTLFARVAESSYRFVAEHRAFFSALTRLAYGNHVERPSHYLVRWTFLRTLGIIYLIAFVSLWAQIDGLVGSQGILPTDQFMESARLQADQQKIGLDRYRQLPTFCWWSASDASLRLQCTAGTVLALLVIIGIAPAPCLVLLWLVYLSLATVCRVFLGFQWDNLLLETGFLAIFFAPLQLWPGPSREDQPSHLVLWLLRLLLFKLMFQSGCVKLLSGDAMWKNLTALTVHYETQPLPTWIGWYAHQLPLWFQKTSCLLMFIIELVIPFLFFAPRRLRMFGGILTALLQVIILLTGNYTFFNWLTLALCLTLLDDFALDKLAPRRLRSLFNKQDTAPPSERGQPCPREPAHEHSRTKLSALLSPPTPSPHPSPPVGERVSEGRVRGLASWLRRGFGESRRICSDCRSHLRRRAVTIPVAIIVVSVTALQFFAMFGVRSRLFTPAMALHQWLAPFRSINNYGLFAVMTKTRPEIIIEGSNDGINWLPYEFKHKPGDVKRRPGFVAPHQPRLDWQMWFAALGNWRQNPWIINLTTRLLRGSPEVLALLETNPFPETPPRFVRASLYEYHFTNFAERRQTGAWWRRQPTGEYLSPISVRASP